MGEKRALRNDSRVLEGWRWFTVPELGGCKRRRWGQRAGIRNWVLFVLIREAH